MPYNFYYWAAFLIGMDTDVFFSVGSTFLLILGQDSLGVLPPYIP